MVAGIDIPRVGPSVREVVRAATRSRAKGATTPPARFALELRPEQDPPEVAAAVRQALAGMRRRIEPFSAYERHILVIELPSQTFEGVEPAAAFSACYTIADAFDLRAVEPDLPTAFFPDVMRAPAAGGVVEESVTDVLPGCFVPREPALDSDPTWALRQMRVPDAWQLSTDGGLPSRGDGVVVAQPDTGVTDHAELAGVRRAGAYDVLDEDPDPADPLVGLNPGHGTSTASVLVSPETLTVEGSAPKASHMPIRAMESVVRVTQVTVARAIEWAVDHGAHVITMSLGGIPSFSLYRAVRRAVESDVIVLAAAGNCVGVVVWPARYDECIAVAATNAAEGPWPGTSRGPAVDISAPGQNVLSATVPAGGQAGASTVDQGQGTSFAVALTAGVAALWLAHHGRADLVAAAHARGETVTGMFRRLVQATARSPAGWDPFAMGPGIVNAVELLAADLDVGRDRESVDAPSEPHTREAITVASLIAEEFEPEAAADEDLDWHRFGPEIATALLQVRSGGSGPQPEVTAPPVSRELADAIGNARLREMLGLDEQPSRELVRGGGRP
jgi:hypothetical protein